MRLEKNRHAVYKLQFRLIIVTKGGHPIIDKEISLRLKEIAKHIFEDSWKCKILEVETEEDHIHIAFESSPQTQLSKLVNNFKTVSSRLIRKEFKNHLRKYYWKDFFWSPSYCLLSVGGAPIEIIREYIRSQKKPQ